MADGLNEANNVVPLFNGLSQDLQYTKPSDENTYTPCNTHDVNNLLNCIETWKMNSLGSNPDTLDKLILDEKVLKNDKLLSCANSDSTDVSDGAEDPVTPKFDETPLAPKENNANEAKVCDNSTLLGVEDIIQASMNDHYDLGLYKANKNLINNSLPRYKYTPVLKAPNILASDITKSTNPNKEMNMKMIEDAAASSEKVRGVCFCKSDKSWTAWWTEKGRNRKKAFKLSIYGYEEARRLAIEYRNAVENRIPELKNKATNRIKNTKRSAAKPLPPLNIRKAENAYDYYGNTMNNRIISRDKKRAKYSYYPELPYHVPETMRECSTFDDSQLPSPITPRITMDVLDSRYNIYSNPPKHDNLDQAYKDTPKGVSYSVVNRAWCTQWCNRNGAASMKSFSVSKYGFERSRAMAIEHQRMLESTNQIAPVNTVPRTEREGYKDAATINETFSKLQLGPQDIYKLATFTLDTEFEELDNAANKTDLTGDKYFKNNLNHKANTIDVTYKGYTDLHSNNKPGHANVTQSQLIKEVPLQKNIANYLSNLLLPNNTEVLNDVNVKFLVGNGSAIHQMLSHKHAHNKVFGLVITTRQLNVELNNCNTN